MLATVKLENGLKIEVEKVDSDFEIVAIGSKICHKSSDCAWLDKRLTEKDLVNIYEALEM